MKCNVAPGPLQGLVPRLACWGLIEVVEDSGGHARGQATSGEHPDIYYRRFPPSMCLYLDPQKGIRDPHIGPIWYLR